MLEALWQCCCGYRNNMSAASRIELLYSFILANDERALRNYLSKHPACFASLPICPLLLAYLSQRASLIPTLFPWQDNLYQSLSYAIFRQCPDFLQALLLEGATIECITCYLTLPDCQWCIPMIQASKDVIFQNETFCILSEATMWRQLERRTHLRNMHAKYLVEYFSEQQNCFVTSCFTTLPKYDSRIRVCAKPYAFDRGKFVDVITLYKY